MPIGPTSIKDKTPALGSEVAFRRIPASSMCWKPPPENRATSAAFNDDEMSVDLLPNAEASSLEWAKQKNEAHLQEGYGLSHSLVDRIRMAFAEKKIEGDVLHDPLPENAEHGLVTGKATKHKSKALQPLFQICVEPNWEVYIKGQMEKKAKQQSPAG